MRNKPYPLQGADRTIEDFEAQMPEPDYQEYAAYNALRVEGAFDGKIYYVFKMDKGQPLILATLRVVDFECSSESGSTIEIENLTTKESMILDHVPRRAFGLPVFMFTATVSALRYTFKDPKKRTLAYPLMLKTEHASSPDHTLRKHTVYVESRKGMKTLFPDIQL